MADKPRRSSRPRITRADGSIDAGALQRALDEIAAFQDTLVGGDVGDVSSLPLNLLSGKVDPSSKGLRAPMGTLYWQLDGTTARLFVKRAAGDRDWKLVRLGLDPTSFRSVAESDATPLAQFMDPHTGKARYLIDRSGLPIPPVHLYQPWLLSAAGSVPDGWNSDTGGTGGNAYVAATTDLPFPCIQISTGATSGSSRKLRSNSLTYLNDDTSFKFQVMVKTGSAVTSSSARVGIEKYPDTTPIQFRFDAASNIYCDVAGTSNALGRVPTVSTVYRLGIEILGQNNHRGSNFLVSFYIDGGRVHQATYSIANPDVAVAFVISNSTAANRTLTIGPAYFVWNGVTDLATF